MEELKSRFVRAGPSRKYTEEECELFSEVMHLAAEQGRTAEEMYQMLEDVGIQRRTADELVGECMGH